MYGSREKSRNLIPILAFLALTVVIVIVIFATAENASKTSANIDKARENITIEHMDGKIVINDDLLSSDYSVYAQNSRNSSRVFLIAVGGMCAFAIFYFIYGLVGMLRKRARGEEMNMMASIIGIVLTGVVTLLFIVVLLVMIKPVLNSQPDEKNARLHASPVIIVDKNSEQIHTGSRKNRKTVTHYYIYSEDGTRFTVSNREYAIVTSTGPYYLAQDEKGTIFNVYPADEYILESGNPFATPTEELTDTESEAA